MSSRDTSVHPHWQYEFVRASIRREVRARAELCRSICCRIYSTSLSSTYVVLKGGYAENLDTNPNRKGSGSKRKAENRPTGQCTVVETAIAFGPCLHSFPVSPLRGPIETTTSVSIPRCFSSGDTHVTGFDVVSIATISCQQSSRLPTQVQEGSRQKS